MPSYLNVMIEGCCHGALDDIYAALREVERRRGVKVDLLICCGDFQGLRSEADFEALAVPAKYREMNSFVKYYRGEAEAPCLTVFVGGNHEASNQLGSLFYGGWVAPKIYYLGAAGSVRVGGLRISGLSGIYNGKHHRWDHFENTADAVDARDAVRSAYHVREVDVFRLALLGRGEVDAFISHDWPRGVEQFGDVRRLLRRKKHFADEVARNDLGSPANELLLKQLRPTHWFSAHLHVKFAALVPHDDGTATRFLALDKCLPRRDFLQLLVLERPCDGPVELEYDAEWLAVLAKTHALGGCLPPPRRRQLPDVFDRPGPGDVAAARAKAEARCGAWGAPAHAPLKIPEDFVPAPPGPPDPRNPLREASPQTDAFLDMLGLPHVVTRPCAAPPAAPAVAPAAPDPAEIALLDDDDDDAAPVADPAEIALADADDDDDDAAAPVVADPAEIALADDDSETG